MTEKIAVAYLKSIKSSPLKVMKVTKSITGTKVSDALKYLQFSNLKVSSAIKSLINSAIANAENNHNMDADSLCIKKIDVGRAFALKRFATRGRGKSSRILKTFSNIRVTLAEYNFDKEESKKTVGKVNVVKNK
jgi:large subunit ribosomal protein L22